MSMLEVLVEKLPAYDQAWPTELQARWFGAYASLLDMARRVPETPCNCVAQPSTSAPAAALPEPVPVTPVTQAVPVAAEPQEPAEQIAVEDGQAVKRARNAGYTSAATRAEIIRLSEEGMRGAHIARQLSLSEWVVYSVIRRHNDERDAQEAASQAPFPAGANGANGTGGVDGAH